MTFDELAKQAEEAAAAQGVDLKPVTQLWRTCIPVGAMTDEQAVFEFIRMMTDSQLDEDGKEKP